uniref:Uncharacterized protein n=1 Tax=Rhizophora mucronata TaxID=61149 RepID=A0A2P2PJB7_RHIMU
MQTLHQRWKAPKRISSYQLTHTELSTVTCRNG